MDYIKIHDSLISRARRREYNKNIHHLHHIIPKHESEDSTDVVPVTFKEHYLLHYLRSKFIKHTTGNYVAYCFMRGIKTIERQKFMAAEGGKIPIWTNGRMNKRASECPGEGWHRGFTKKINFITEYIEEVRI